ncbi:peptidoglycan-binding protein [Streptomyces sp. ACA25]|uniref:peptidoglycan-binding protein n=1 Tax=Streptomyces sp. ACA25 TaxID=3022596 RepID=UPI0023075A4A|nr:peptidoglycan-binding protein [Streptomyces sp. ACA25]MDB1087084.1 peptidoglycan-binding protein [Streptomyces sp. ACA25]
MASWKELPGALGPQERRLVVQLRTLKDHSGLSLAALGRRTGYSSSSWERYLNGKKLAPAPAVRELAALGGVDPERLLALQALAAAGRTQAPDGTPAAEAAPAEGEAHRVRTEQPGEPEEPAGDLSPRAAVAESAPSGPGPRFRRTAPLLGALLALTGGVAALLLWTGRDSTEGDSFVLEAGRTYGCSVHSQAGQRYAGHSETQDAVLYQVVTGWEVVEAQCLLEHHGFTVGTVDGVYDALTERAVKRFQEADGGLVIDGIIGPHTWEVLRR